MTKQLLSEIATEALAFVSERQSLQLATIDLSGRPLASYAPFYRSEDGKFYIFVSALAAHSENLVNAAVSILLISDEVDTKQNFARERISFQCHSTVVPADTETHLEILQNLRIKHGDIVSMLSSLPDFTMYKLQPSSGRYIRAFGQAYDIDPEISTVVPVQP